MVRKRGLAAALLGMALVAWRAEAADIVPGDPLIGDGSVDRTANGYADLMKPSSPRALAEGSAYALPARAAPATGTFEGTLTLTPCKAAYFRILYDAYDQMQGGRAKRDYDRLPAFSVRFVQAGSYLVPALQGLRITGDRSWNLIVGPGRVWSETADHGYSRASLPFALVQRNQNCLHNGTMTFLFNGNAHPNVSHVAYQITGEGCPTLKFDMAGQASARYRPGPVRNAEAIRAKEAQEIAGRLPVKPFAALATDFPASGIDLAAFPAQYAHPENITTYGVVIGRVNYSSGCATRHGEYPFCAEMRLPSYSTAKSAFSSLAMMRLGQLYGPKVYDALIQSYLPQHVEGGNWTGVTLGHASDMATGNYLATAYLEDEDSDATTDFLLAESYADKIAAAFRPFPRQAPPGTRWVYQSAATFIQTQAMNALLKSRRGPTADLFRMMSAEIYRPLKTSEGFLATLRAGNSEDGAPFGFNGLFYTIDDAAKIGQFFGAGTGRVDGVQLVDPVRLKEALFRAGNNGLPVPDTHETLVYSHNFWGRKVTPAEFPGIGCAFTVPFMSGYGGITIMPLPNGATYYVFSTGYEFPIGAAIREIGKLAPYCG